MTDPSATKNLEEFGYGLHEQLSNANPGKNLIYSPLSIQMCAAMVRMGAEEGTATARELDEGLRFSASNVDKIADGFEAVFSAFRQCKALKMANKLFIMKECKPNQRFASILEKKYHSKPKSIDFGSSSAAETINSWVEEETNKLIKNIVSPGALTNSTRLVLVNAIYFKGVWSIRFDEEDTREEEFFLEKGKPIKVSMMKVVHKFMYAELPKLGARAIKMLYTDCNLSMIIILPNESTGLKTLEQKLPTTSLKAITSDMSLIKVDVKIPKFRVEFEQELSSAFKKMGIKRIFSDEAELGQILESQEAIKVSQILHKAFIDVNEVGTEAAAATAAVMVMRSLPATPVDRPKAFHANRPFYYTICDRNHGILFVGSVTAGVIPIETAKHSGIVTNICGAHSTLSLAACWLPSLLFLTITLSPFVEPVQTTSDVTMPETKEVEFSRRLAIFSLNVYQKLSLLKPGENVVFSPFSIQTCAAMARLGAEGETAAELDRGLGLVSSDAAKIAQSFHQVLAAYEKSQILHIANKIFVMQGYPLREEFNQLLTKEFLSAAQSVNFAESAQAAGTINAWVEQSTNNLIKDLVPSSALDANSRLVLVNAIHFKGTWEHKFPQHATQQELFHLNEEHSTKVPMMNLKKKFRYADLPDLGAAALELGYADSDLSMLVVLPNSRTGLPALEEKLRGTLLSVITQSLQKTEVVVKLPKFRAEFQVELSEVFKQLGMSKMFGNNAEFNKMLQSPEQLKVSAIIHKAFIDVNEEGTEAAAATGAVVRMKRSIVSLAEPIEFHADHPFIYALVHRADLPLFWGSVVRPQEMASESGAAHNEL
ncbi:uncharacterized protein LOC6590792 [Drosophila persimilis]|nr:uncharacterized protein LOC6590792 [Drosophila persimilis]